MKKVLAILFAAAIALSAAACGTANTTTTDPAETSASTEAVTTAATTTVATTEAEFGMIDAEEAIVDTWVTTEGDGYIFNGEAVKIIFADGTETTGSYTIERKVGEGAFELTITDSATAETSVYTLKFVTYDEINVTADGYTSTWTSHNEPDADFDPEAVNAEEVIVKTWSTTEGDGYIFSEDAVKIIFADGTQATGTYTIAENDEAGKFDLTITKSASGETTVYTVEFVSENEMNVTAEGYSSTWNS